MAADSVAADGVAADGVGAGAAGDAPVLSVEDLRVYYATPGGDVRATDGVSFALYPGETLGLVGESGSGKSTAVAGVLQMVAAPGRIAGGRVRLCGEEMLGLAEEALRARRWRTLSLIPQGAMNSLNPTMSIAAQIGDVIETHEGRQERGALKARILALFQTVGLPGRIYGMFPHELSGGMKQRVCIAMAIALNPAVIIADEATSALDVVVQRVVAQTLARVKARLGVAMIMIGHDMGLMAQMADRIAVMYAGRIVETARVRDLFAQPGHPYSEILIASVPSLTERQPMRIMGGITHDPRNPPPGCIFQLRCPHVQARCRVEDPVAREIRPGQTVACHLWQETGEAGYVRTETAPDP